MGGAATVGAGLEERVRKGTDFTPSRPDRDMAPYGPLVNT